MLDELDRELLWTFATGIGWAMDDIAGRGTRRAADEDGETADEPLLTAARIGGAELDGELSGAARPPRDADRARAGGPAPHERGRVERRDRQALVISQATVKSHVRHILRKLGAANRTEAVSLFLATGARR